MFELFCEQIRTRNKEISVESSSLNKLCRDVEHVRTVLSELSGMGDVCNSLDFICNKMRLESGRLNEMKTETDRIIALYEEKEMVLKERVFQIY